MYFQSIFLDSALTNSVVVYCNSCLATLNARKSIRGLGEEDTDELSFSLQSFDKSGSKPMTSSVRPPPDSLPPESDAVLSPSLPQPQ